MLRFGWLILCLSLAVGFAGARFAAPAHAQSDAPVATGGSIAGFVFLDSDGDGALGPSEPGLSVVPVQLKGPVDRTVLSSTSGAYSFSDLPAGSYDISVEPGLEWAVRSQGMYAGLVVNGDVLENVNFSLVAVDLPVDDAPTGAAATDTGGPAGAAPATAPDNALDPVAMAAQVISGLSEGDSGELDPAVLAALSQALDEIQAEGGTPTLGDVLARGLAAVSAAPAAPAAPEPAPDSGAASGLSGDPAVTEGGLASSAYGTSSYEGSPESAETSPGSSVPLVPGAPADDAAFGAAPSVDDPAHARPFILPDVGSRAEGPGGGAPPRAAAARPYLPSSGLGAPDGMGFALALGLVLGVVVTAGVVVERR